MSAPFWWWSGASSSASGASEAIPASGTLLGPAARLGPEMLLPSWMTARTELSERLFRLLQHLAEAAVPARESMRRIGRSQVVSTTETGENRLEFLLPAPKAQAGDVTVTHTIGAVTQTVRRAISVFDYQTTPEPVFWLDRTAHTLAVRNLHMRGAQLAGSGTVYSLMEDPLPESGIYHRRDVTQNWEWLTPDTLALQGRLFQMPVSGTWLVQYGSLGRATALASGATLSVQWPGGGTGSQFVLPLTPANRFDGWGALLDLPRHDGETNTTYQTRLAALAAGPGDPTAAGVARGIALPLSAVSALAWDGVTDLTLDTDGTSGITGLLVVGEGRWLKVSETLAPASGNQVFYTTYANWRTGSLVTLDGVPQAGMAVSGNRLTLSAPVTGRIAVEYSVERYRTALLSGGTIGTLYAGTGMPSGSYVVILTHQVRVLVPDQPDVQLTHLLTAAGLPNALFLELAARLTADNPIALARARWGPAAFWATESEAKPPSARLPLPFDLHL